MRDSNEHRKGLSRRTVLRSGAVAAGILAFGVPGEAATPAGDVGDVTAAVGKSRTRGAGGALSHGGVPDTLEATLDAADGDDGDRFGGAVAVDGDTAVVGAPDDEDPDGSGSGSAYVFTRAGTTWSQQAKLGASDGAAGDGFGWSVALDGDTAVVGAPDEGDANGDGKGAGAAYVFTRSGGAWSQQAKLTAGDGQDDDRLGWKVAVDGDTAAIAARRDTIPVPGLPDEVTASSTYVFTRSGGTWTQTAKLTVSDHPNDDVVSALALDDDTLVVGDEGDVENGDLSGAAYVFTRSGGTWSSPTKLTAADASRFDEFGRAVAVDGDLVVVGAPGADDPNGEHAGAVYVFSRSGGSWPQDEKLAASDGASGDVFGTAVGVADGVVVAGAPGDDSATGAVYTFSPSGPSWVEGPKLVPGDAGDEVGESLAMAGHTAVVGAPGDEDPNGTDAGSAYVYAANRGPTASFTVSPDPVLAGEAATFDASGSTDPDGSIVTYEWDWDGDGSYETTTGDATTTHTFGSAGRYDVTLRVTDDDGATDTATATVTVGYRVNVRIKPGGGRNPINPRSRGVIPVAVLGSSSFDATTMDASTVRFGDPDDVSFDAAGDTQGGATPAHGDGHVEDVNGDGYDDRVFHFPTQDADFEGDDTEGELLGRTDDGLPVVGTDGVTIVGR